MSFPVVCPGHTKAVVELHYSEPTPDGTFFICASLDRLPMLRDAASGDWIGTFQGHKGAVWSAKLTRDATRAATGSADFSATVWDALTGNQLHSYEHKHVVRSVDFSQDATHLSTGGQDKVLRIFALDRADAAPIAAYECPEKIRKVVWLQDGRRVATGTEDGVLRVYDVASGNVVMESNLASGSVMDVELSHDGRLLTVAAGQTVAVLSADTLEVKHKHTLPSVVEGASLHPVHGRHFISGGTDVWVRMFDVETGTELSCQKGHHGTVHCVRFAPNGETYASGADDATIRLWKYEEASSPPAKGTASFPQAASSASGIAVGSAAGHEGSD